MLKTSPVLHHPFRQVDELRSHEYGGGQYDSFEEAYEFCKGAHVHNEPDVYGVESPLAPKDPFDDLDIDSDNDAEAPLL